MNDDCITHATYKNLNIWTTNQCWLWGLCTQGLTSFGFYELGSNQRYFSKHKLFPAKAYVTFVSHSWPEWFVCAAFKYWLLTAVWFLFQWKPCEMLWRCDLFPHFLKELALDLLLQMHDKGITYKFELWVMLSLCIRHVATVTRPFRSTVFHFLTKPSKICEIFFSCEK